MHAVVHPGLICNVGRFVIDVKNTATTQMVGNFRLKNEVEGMKYLQFYVEHYRTSNGLGISSLEIVF